MRVPLPKTHSHGCGVLLRNGAALTRDEVTDSLDGAPTWDTFEIMGPLIGFGRHTVALVYLTASLRPSR